MPNVEIHGLMPEEAKLVRNRIWAEFADAHYLGDMVVTICPTIVTDFQGTHQPFLRLVNTEAAPDRSIEEDAVKCLYRLSMDLEIMRLDRFIETPKISCPHCKSNIGGGMEGVRHHVSLSHPCVAGESGL